MSSGKLAVLGCAGSIGKRVVLLALKKGYTVIGIDIVSSFQPPPVPESNSSSHCAIDSNFRYVSVDLRDYDGVVNALNGCDAIVLLAAYRNPGDYVVQTHNSNVVISWNVLRAAAQLGINRIAQASSVNIITMVYSQHSNFEYFPIDEDHPCEAEFYLSVRSDESKWRYLGLPDEPYGLSKLIAELQAETIVRRYPSIRIASLRLHWSVPSKAHATGRLDQDRAVKDLWGYVQEDSSAEAFLLAVEESDKWAGHEAFFIASPDIASDIDTKELREKYYQDVPIRNGHSVGGKNGFFNCSKAKRLLGWEHAD